MGDMKDMKWRKRKTERAGRKSVVRENKNEAKRKMSPLGEKTSMEEENMEVK